MKSGTNSIWRGTLGVIIIVVLIAAVVHCTRSATSAPPVIVPQPVDSTSTTQAKPKHTPARANDKPRSTPPRRQPLDDVHYGN